MAEHLFTSHREGLELVARPVAEHGQTGLLRDVTELMVMFESAHHARGWDNSPPTLYCLVRTPAAYGAGVLTLTTELDTPDELAQWVRAMEINAVRSDTLHYTFPPVGHVLVVETWATNVLIDLRDDTAPMVTPQESERTRMVLGVVRNHRLLIERPQGSGLVFDHWTATEYPDTGCIIETLARGYRVARTMYHQAKLRERN